MQLLDTTYKQKVMYGKRKMVEARARREIRSENQATRKGWPLYTIKRTRSRIYSKKGAAVARSESVWPYEALTSNSRCDPSRRRVRPDRAVSEASRSLGRDELAYKGDLSRTPGCFRTYYTRCKEQHHGEFASRPQPSNPLCGHRCFQSQTRCGRACRPATEPARLCQQCSWLPATLRLVGRLCCQSRSHLFGSHRLLLAARGHLLRAGRLCRQCAQPRCAGRLSAQPQSAPQKRCPRCQLAGTVCSGKAAAAVASAPAGSASPAPLAAPASPVARPAHPAHQFSGGSPVAGTDSPAVAQAARADQAAASDL